MTTDHEILSLCQTSLKCWCVRVSPRAKWMLFELGLAQLSTECTVVIFFFKAAFPSFSYQRSLVAKSNSNTTIFWCNMASLNIAHVGQFDWSCCKCIMDKRSENLMFVILAFFRQTTFYFWILLCLIYLLKYGETISDNWHQHFMLANMLLLNLN